MDKTLPLEVWVIILKGLDKRSAFSVSCVNRRLKAATRLAAPQVWQKIEKNHASQFVDHAAIEEEHAEAGSIIAGLLQAEELLSSHAPFWTHIRRIDFGAITAFSRSCFLGQSYLLVAYDTHLFRVFNPEDGEIIFSLKVPHYFHSDFASLFIPTRRQIVTLPRNSRRDDASSFLCAYGDDAHMRSLAKLESVDGMDGTCQVRGFVWKGGVVVAIRSSGGYWTNVDRFSWADGSPMIAEMSLEIGDAVDVHLQEDFLIHLHRRFSGTGAAYRYYLKKTGLQCGLTELLVRLAYPSNSPSASLISVPLGPVHRFIARQSQCGVVEGRIHDSGGLLQMDGRGHLRFGLFGKVLNARALVPNLAPNTFHAGGRWYAARSLTDPRAFFLVHLLSQPWHLSF